MPDNSGLLFPTDISFGSKGGPQYATSIVIRKSGRETRNQNWTYPLHLYDVAYGVKTQAQMNALIAFFHLHYGRAVGFLYQDPEDYQVPTTDGLGATASDGILGTTGLGDGSTTSFQMHKRYIVGASTKTRKITRPKNGTISIYKGGVLQSSGFTINYATGIVTFTPAPANGVAVTWQGDFYVPCRFDTDTLQVDAADRAGGSGALILSTAVPVMEERE
jgi:uncharacterized protein (TIGR02217 family)